MFILYHPSCKWPGEYFFNQSREALVEKAVALWAESGYFGEKEEAERIIRLAFAKGNRLDWPKDEDFPAQIFEAKPL